MKKILLFFLSLALPALPVLALAQTDTKVLEPLTIAAGKSHVIAAPSDLTRVSVGNPDIVDIALLRSRDIYVIGKSAGSTNIFMWGKKGDMSVMDVSVSVDTSGLARKLKELMPEENEIQVRSAGDSLVLFGRARDSVKVQTAMQIAEKFSGKKVINLLGLGDVPQVLLEVKVAEVSKKLTDKLGVELGVNGANGGFNYSMLASFLTGGALSSPAGSGGGISLIDGNDSLKLEAEIKNGLVKVLAEPNIIAVSGQEGAFLAGGKIFIPVPQSSASGTTITLEEREYGVGLKFIPVVLETGKINLRVTPEVSELALEGTVVKSGGVSNVLPTITTRRASTTVQLMDGQTFAIGGLIKNNITETVKAFPVLGEIPIFGALFRSSEFISDRSELMFIVTPRLVKPVATTVSLPTDKFVPPGRSEFLLEGRLEGRAAPVTPDSAVSNQSTKSQSE